MVSTRPPGALPHAEVRGEVAGGQLQPGAQVADLDPARLVLITLTPAVPLGPG